MTKPFSQACENNKHPILDVIAPYLAQSRQVFEIGSGTGQHAVFFASQYPNLVWNTSDRIQNHAGIRQWIVDSAVSNVEQPVELDVSIGPWPEQHFDMVFTANTGHIMHWPEVEAMFNGVSRILAKNGMYVIYGPFNYRNNYTSESNARFDQSLKTNDPESGIRDFEKMRSLAAEHSMQLLDDVAMPANNRLLLFRFADAD